MGGLKGPPGFLVPTLALRHTQYQVHGGAPGADPRPARTLPLLSLDAGLFLERPLGLLPGGIQTLEPRAYFLYVPYRDQSRLLREADGTARVFDSGLPDLTLARLFQDNRFTGADRQGDARQLSLAVTTRLVDAQGRERLRAAAGRIFYFADRRVTLPGGAPETAARSPVVGELQLAAGPWRGRSSLEWAPRDGLGRLAADMAYRRGRRRLELGYSYRARRLRQAEAVLVWPLGPRWTVLGRWLRDLETGLTLESVRGLSYESCCWALSVAQRRRVSQGETAVPTDTLWLQLQLKGLSSLGRDLGALLERGMLSP